MGRAPIVAVGVPDENVQDALDEFAAALTAQMMTTEALITKYIRPYRVSLNAARAILGHADVDRMSMHSKRAFVSGAVSFRRDHCASCNFLEQIGSRLNGQDFDHGDVVRYHGVYTSYFVDHASGALLDNVVDIRECKDCDRTVVQVHGSSGRRRIRKGGAWVMRNALHILIVEKAYMALAIVRAADDPDAEYMSGVLTLHDWTPHVVPFASRITFVKDSLARTLGEVALDRDLPAILANQCAHPNAISGWPPTPPPISTKRKNRVGTSSMRCHLRLWRIKAGSTVRRMSARPPFPLAGPMRPR